jgi:hypothetical protein
MPLAGCGENERGPPGAGSEEYFFPDGLAGEGNILGVARILTSLQWHDAKSCNTD